MDNILIIQTDQQSLWTLSCYGGTLIHTPNVDRLANEGVKFDNFFTPSAVCTPSRGCFVTGRYPHSNGAYRNDEPLNKDEITFSKIMKDNGYETGYAGKWHLNGGEYPGWISSEDSMGFDDCKYMFNCGHYKEVLEKDQGNPIVSFDIGNEETYMTDWLTNKTIDFIKKDRNKPFCFMVSFPDPHQPFSVREPYDKMYNPEDMPIPPSFYQESLPDWAEDDEWGRKRYFPIGLKNREEELRKIKARYCGEVKCIDDNVGRIIEYLEKENILDDTIVVFTTDHGEYMGKHGLLEKNNLYDSVYRIPMVIRWPKKIKSGTVVDKYVNIVDFQQTILSLMGLKPSGREQGRDVSPLVLGDDMQYPDEIFIHPSDVPRTGIITREYELAYVGRGWNREEGHTFTDHILFDRINDPEQMDNLYNKPEYASVIESLTERVINHHKKIGTDFSILPQLLQKGLNYRGDINENMSITI